MTKEQKMIILRSRYGGSPQYVEIRCCCHPENLLGYLPKDTPGYELRELEDGSEAFDSNHDEEAVRATDGFIPFEGETAGKKTWKKTWRK